MRASNIIGVLTVFFATQTFGASGVRADSGVSVLNRAQLGIAYEARADHLVLLAAAIAGAPGSLAHGRLGVFRQAVVVGTLKARADDVWSFFTTIVHIRVKSVYKRNQKDVKLAHTLQATWHD